MQTWRPAAIPAVLQAGKRKEQPDGSGELGEWVCGDDEQPQTPCPPARPGNSLSEAYSHLLSPWGLIPTPIILLL